MRTLALLFPLTLALLGGCASRAPTSPSPSPSPVAVTSPQEIAARALQRGDYAEALRRYGALHQEAPDDPAYRQGLGEAWLGLGEARPALALFEQRLAAQPYDVDALLGAGLAQLGLQQYEAAEARLQRVLAQRPQSWQALNAMGLIADLHANYPEASDWYEQALAARPGEPAIYNNYGYSRLMAGAYREAETLLAQGLRHSPRNLRLRNNLLQAVAWQGDYRRALSLRGEVPLHEALNNIGYIAWLRQDSGAARRLFEQALDASPSWYSAAAANLERLEQARVTARASTARR